MAGYDRQGGKNNRRQQLKRAASVCDWVQRNCQVHHLGQLGGRHIVQFWKAHANLADSTKYSYWLALRQLWRCAGKAGDPPRPVILTVLPVPANPGPALLQPREPA